jgi:hypothetical protein
VQALHRALPAGRFSALVEAEFDRMPGEVQSHLCAVHVVTMISVMLN